MTEDRLLRSVQRLSSALSRLERQAASRSGVSVSQLRVMVYLHESAGAGEGIRISDLADDQGLAVSTMTRNLALLEKKGWLARRQGAKDKRTVLIALTDQGREIARGLQETTLGQLNTVFRAFHPSDRVERAVALDRVAAAIEHADDDPSSDE